MAEVQRLALLGEKGSSLSDLVHNLEAGANATLVMRVESPDEDGAPLVVEVKSNELLHSVEDPDEVATLTQDLIDWADAVFLVYHRESRASFEALPLLRAKIPTSVPIMLVANYSAYDSFHDGSVTYAEAQRLSDKWHCPLFKYDGADASLTDVMGGFSDDAASSSGSRATSSGSTSSSRGSRRSRSSSSEALAGSDGPRFRRKLSVRFAEDHPDASHAERYADALGDDPDTTVLRSPGVVTPGDAAAAPAGKHSPIAALNSPGVGKGSIAISQAGVLARAQPRPQGNGSDDDGGFDDDDDDASEEDSEEDYVVEEDDDEEDNGGDHEDAKEDEVQEKKDKIGSADITSVAARQEAAAATAIVKPASPEGAPAASVSSPVRRGRSQSVPSPVITPQDSDDGSGTPVWAGRKPSELRKIQRASSQSPSPRSASSRSLSSAASSSSDRSVSPRKRPASTAARRSVSPRKRPTSSHGNVSPRKTGHSASPGVSSPVAGRNASPGVSSPVAGRTASPGVSSPSSVSLAPSSPHGVRPSRTMGAGPTSSSQQRVSFSTPV